jgi:hypothetical protein
MSFLRSRRLLKVRRMRTTQLLTAFRFTSDPEIRADARHGVAYVPLIRGSLGGGLNDVDVQTCDVAAETIEEMAITSSQSAVWLVVVVTASGCDFEFGACGCCASLEACVDSSLEGFKAGAGCRSYDKAAGAVCVDYVWTKTAVGAGRRISKASMEPEGAGALSYI